MLSATTTLNAGYRLKYYCDTLGLFLNNEIDDLIAKQFPTCLDCWVTKQIALFRKEDVKLYDSTIVEKNGKLFMFAMPSGGSTIITSVLQTILNVDEYNLSAVNARFHHQ
jgi:gamma-glutamyltranspeptidase/glutathione hydrolase